MTFGAFISAKRKELRLTLRETAKHLGIACGYANSLAVAQFNVNKGALDIGSSPGPYTCPL